MSEVRPAKLDPRQSLVTEFRNVTRKQVIDLLYMFEIDRERGLRMTQIADEFTISTAPVSGGLVRIFPNNDGTFTVEDHTS